MELIIIHEICEKRSIAEGETVKKMLQKPGPSLSVQSKYLGLGIISGHNVPNCP